MKKLSKREKFIAGICVMFVASYIGYGLIYKPADKEVAYLDGEIQRKQREIVKGLSIIKKEKRREGEYRSIEQKFKQGKPDEQVMSVLLAEIESVAHGLEIKISNLNPQKLKKENGYHYFSVSLTLDSSLEDILRFIYLLQREPHIFYIEDLRLDKVTRKKSQKIKTRLVLGKLLIP